MVWCHFYPYLILILLYCSISIYWACLVSFFFLKICVLPFQLEVYLISKSNVYSLYSQNTAQVDKLFVICYNLGHCFCYYNINQEVVLKKKMLALVICIPNPPQKKPIQRLENLNWGSMRITFTMTKWLKTL